ncbi:Two-component hybrid sensor and regulator [Enhygromyxa salina]|uniref:histidine kinase n=1 Tax=Enhygromyxa salina TaxID=215803 RepID=A0A0C2CM92_9BACT|nr:HAMP domain-containing sensor histidine kinase [Enhygromyxa salina]KIG12371.1 Two-component hybrid sensor and regulator [Enhygromyxa salina]
MTPVNAILMCDLAGIVREVVREAPFLDLSRARGQPLVALLDPESTLKACAMLDALRTTGWAADWDLTAKVSDALVAIRVTGVTRDGRSMLIVTAPDHDGPDLDLESEFMDANREHANALRALLREGVGRRRDAASLEHLTRLNNEMAVVQRDLAKKNAELARINAQKDTILAFVAHDLRTPLGAVLGFTKLIHRDPNQLSARQVRFLDSISSMTKFMAEMVTDLLEISALESGKLVLDRKPLELGELIARAIVFNEMVARDKGISIAIERARGPAWVEGDASKLEQVMNNLLSNAIKYSHPGTGVMVMVESDAKHVCVEVRDRGQGIPPTELDHVFEAFRTTSVKATAGEKSTGLGLAIVKRIVEAHQGRIWVESEVGVGTSFRAQFPSCAAPT